MHFTCAGDSEEDCGNLDYLRDVATQAGVTTRFVAVEDIGWNAARGTFVDTDDVEISVLMQALSVGMAGRRGVRPAPASTRASA